MSKKNFHITTGDTDGIGLEVSLKAIKKIQKKVKTKTLIIWLHKGQINPLMTFLNSNKFIKNRSKIINSLHEVDSNINFNFIISKKNQPAHWFEEAVKDCINSGSSVITAPLSKTQIKAEGLKDIGHTEILKRLTKRLDLKMCFFGKYFSVILYTDHIPVSNIKINKNPLSAFIKSSQELHKNLKSKASQFFVLGLNPHAGDSGLIGTEDSNILSWSKAFGINKLLPADSAFVNYRKFKHNPTFLSLYHDQGLIPFKMAHGFSGFHYTMGLPFIRTSVDHGTAKDIFGENKADPTSMADAVLAAFKLSKNGSLS